MTKKVILLLVEGPTDEDALALVCSRLVKAYDIEFDVLHTDITADEDMTVKYIEKRVKTEVEIYLKKNPFIKRTDILKVVQIIDTDGAFVPCEQIKQSKMGKTEYFETHIEAKNQNRLIRRNLSKRNIVFQLSRMEVVGGFSYEIYYFSRNLEHVLHNLPQELTDDEKETLAFKIADYYSQCPEEFLYLLRNAPFHVKGTYEETWKFIMEDGNSLRRYCNMSVFFDTLDIAI